MSKNFDQNHELILDESLDNIMSFSFKKYAKYVIQDRALSDIRDGLKPVQRRILFAMYELGLFHNKPYKKSARTVGEVIGKYHPHGDSSIYEAMVRMSQDWKNNFPLIEMNGNNGSIDGDSAAAMRYTEARLSLYGETLLKDLYKDTVGFIFNFDDSEKEPSVLPSLLPNILINGATGIAAGYAANIPLFNLHEVIIAIKHRINNPKCTYLDILSIMPGPDFPTGGIIQSKSGIIDIYQTGRGKIFIKAQSELIDFNSKIKQLKITSIPYEVNKAILIKSIDEIRINNKVPGIIEVRDESDKNGISICIDIDKNYNIGAIYNYLFKNTQLNISYNANIILIKDKKPQLVGIIEIIDSYLLWANNILINKAKHELQKQIARKEIIDGILIVLGDLNLLIDLLKSAQSKNDLHDKLVLSFNLNTNQADAVINLKLYNLTNFDKNKLIEENEEIDKKIKENNLIINDHFFRQKRIKMILDEYDHIFYSKRKSIIQEEIDQYTFNELDIIKDRDLSLIITKNQFFVLNSDFIEKNRILDFKYKENDWFLFLNCLINTMDWLFIFTSKGRYISIPVYKLPESNLKTIINNSLDNFIKFDIDEKIIFCLNSNQDNYYQILLCAKNGFVKKVNINNLTFNCAIKSKKIFKLKDDNTLNFASLVQKQHEFVILISKLGKYKIYNLNEIYEQSSLTLGIKMFKLDKNDELCSCLSFSNQDRYIVIATNKTYVKIFIKELINNPNSYAKMFPNLNQDHYIIKSILHSDNDYIVVKNNQQTKVNINEILYSPIKNNLTPKYVINDLVEISDFYYDFNKYEMEKKDEENK